MTSSEPLEKDQKFLNQTISSLTDQIDLFETFQDLSLKIISQFDLENIFLTASGIIRELLNFKSAAIYLLKTESGRYEKVFQQGGDPESDLNEPVDMKLIEWVMNQGRWTVITDVQDPTARRIVSMLPLKSPGRSLGFMGIVTDLNPVLYTQKMSSIVNFIASQTAIAIENQTLYAQLNQANIYMNDMLESINNGLMAVDVSGQVTLINKNATAILGIKERSIKGIHYSQLISGELKTELDRLFQTLMTKGFAAETMVSHTPLKEVNIMIGVTPSLLTDKLKNTIGVIFIFRDMSVSKEVERLTRLDEMKSEFVSNVSHELRTPLAVIKSYTEALLTQVEADDHLTRENFLSVIDGETDRLSTIVSNLLDLSRIEAGKFDLQMTTFSLKELVNSIVPIYKSRKSQIDIITDFQPGLPDITADENKIREVLINLIANSIKFSPGGGIISVLLEKDKGYIACSVSDTGIGIPKDKLGKIFKKFYRVDNSNTCETEGTGLGLSIVKHIIDAHKGRIKVDSSLGKGSVFTFYLPLSETQDHAV